MFRLNRTHSLRASTKSSIPLVASRSSVRSSVPLVRKRQSQQADFCRCAAKEAASATKEKAASAAFFAFGHNPLPLRFAQQLARTFPYTAAYPDASWNASYHFY